MNTDKPTLKSYFTKTHIFISIVLLLFLIPVFILIKTEASNFLQKKITEQLSGQAENIISTQSLSIKNYIEFKRKTLNHQIKTNLRNSVYNAYKTAYSIFNAQKNILPVNELQKLIKTSLKYQIFNNDRGHYFVFSTTGKKILNPQNSAKDNTFVFTIRKMLQLINKKAEGFYSCVSPHPYCKDKFCKKIFFIKLFEPFHWIIGTSEYYEHFEKELKREVIKRLENYKMPKNTGFILLEKKHFLIKANINLSDKDILKISDNHTKHLVYKNYHFHNNCTIPQWNWQIITFFNVSYLTSTSEYIVKRYNELLIIIFIIAAFVLTFIFIIIFFFNANFYQKIIKETVIFKNFFHDLPDKFTRIKEESFSFKEFVELSQAANKMSDSLETLHKIKQNLFNKITTERNYNRFIIENIGIAVIIANRLGNIEFFNSTAQETLQYSSEDFETLELHSLLRPHDISGNIIRQEECPVCGVYQSKRKLYTKYILISDKNNNKIPVSLLAVPIFKNNAIDKIIISFRDISLEMRRRYEIEKLKRAIEQTPVSVVITDNNATIEYVNPFFCKVTGYTFDEAIGANPRILKTEHNNKLYEDLWSTITSGKTWKGEFLNKKKNGELYWEQAIVSPVYNEAGKISNFIAVKQDITELKKIYNELVEAKNRAEKANKLKSEFLANMSHEIRTPMNAIIGFTELLLETNINETQKKYIELVKASSENLLQILNDILDISKLESGKMEYNNAPFNLISLIERQISIFSQKAKDKGLKLSYNINKLTHENFMGDEVRIAQIISNLLNNAIKFTEKGEVGIDVSVKSQNEKYFTLLFQIYDTGVGIPSNKLETIFSPFVQADSSVTKRFGGTGLGLSISKKIVNFYNGDIWVESATNKGSKFYFTLQLEVSKSKVEKRKKGDRQKVIFKNAKVLVAEDNTTNQILIQELLKKIGIKPIMVENGIEALQKLSEYDFDVILMDWHMPEMDGAEAVKILRMAEQGKLARDNRIPAETLEKLLNRKFKIIALTAAAMVHERKKLFEIGFDEYLAKPVRPTILVEILKKFIKNYKPADKVGIFSDYLQVDSSYIKELVGDDEDVMAKLMDSFKHTLTDTVKKIKNNIKTNDFQKISILAHTLKGAAGSIGIKEIYETAKSIEFSAKNKNIEQIKIDIEYLSKIKFNID